MKGECLYLIAGFLLVVLTGSMQSSQQVDAQLDRYGSANDSLRKNQVPVEVVLMGNSITDSWPDMRPAFFEETGYIGRGIGGQTTPQMMLRFQQDVINLSPKVVVILAGTNDIAGNTGPMSLEEIMENIVEMTARATKEGIRVIIASVLPAKDYPWVPGKSPDVKIPALNEMLSKYAQEQNLVYLDYFAAMTDGSNGLQAHLTYDGVHPNQEGYHVMEPLLLSAVNLALGNK